MVAESWRVEDGTLSSIRPEVLLATDEDFASFELLAEYRVEKATYATLYLRGDAALELVDGMSLTHPALAWGAINDGPGIYDGKKGSGALVGNAPWTEGAAPRVRADHEPGAWNRLHVTMVGERVTVRINDELVLDGARAEHVDDRRLPLCERGPLLLGLSSKSIRWRNLFVRDLDAEESRLLLDAIDLGDLGVQRQTAGWPTLEPFQASRFWAVVTSYSGAHPGERQSADTLARSSQMASIFQSAAGSGQRSAAIVPFVMHALAPLWSDSDWDASDFELVRACSVLLAEVPEVMGAPKLAYAEDDREQAGASLNELARWFEKTVAQPAGYAAMIFTCDDGPFEPRRLSTAGEHKAAGVLPLSGTAAVRLLTAGGNARNVVEIASAGEILHRVTLDEIAGDLRVEDADPPLELGVYGWRVHFRFGPPRDVETAFLYLDAELRPLFYFASW